MTWYRILFDQVSLTCYRLNITHFNSYPCQYFVIVSPKTNILFNKQRGTEIPTENWAITIIEICGSNLSSPQHNKTSERRRLLFIDGKVDAYTYDFLIVCINHHPNIFFAASFSRRVVAFKMKVLQNFGMLNIIFFCLWTDDDYYYVCANWIDWLRTHELNIWSNYFLFSNLRGDITLGTNRKISK